MAHLRAALARLVDKLPADVDADDRLIATELAGENLCRVAVGRACAATGGPISLARGTDWGKRGQCGAPMSIASAGRASSRGRMRACSRYSSVLRTRSTRAAVLRGDPGPVGPVSASSCTVPSCRCSSKRARSSAAIPRVTARKRPLLLLLLVQLGCTLNDLSASDSRIRGQTPLH